MYYITNSFIMFLLNLLVMSYFNIIVKGLLVYITDLVERDLRIDMYCT